MIPWAGDVMHDGAAIVEAIQTYLRAPKTEAVPEASRCVNEGAEGCTLRAEENGWCGPCWRQIVPAS